MTVSRPAIDIDHLKTWIGREQTVENGLPPASARALSAALERDDHRPALPSAGDALPPAWQWLYFLETPSALNTGTDGHPKTGGFLPPVPLGRRMWAAGNFKIRRPLMLGRSARKKSVVSDVELKEGASGTLVFVTVKHTVDQFSEVCIEEEQNLVYLEIPTRASPLPPGRRAPDDADFCINIQPDPVLLFRYSALTYNSHRIHYDRLYAVESEFYPGLVVHGPLQATLLADSAAKFFGDDGKFRVADFSFRAQRPLFDSDPLSICGTREGDELRLWTRSHDGFIGMTATARLTDGEGVR